MIVALWTYFSATAYNKFKSAYNKCVKKMFGYMRRDSMTGVLLELSLPTFDTVIHNSRIIFANQVPGYQCLVTILYNGFIYRCRRCFIAGLCDFTITFISTQ